MKQMFMSPDVSAFLPGLAISHPMRDVLNLAKGKRIA
ncbi:MAG: hypothetical protein ACJATW_001218 [Glaciecola sp.]|jgi:hypothetical protein